MFMISRVFVWMFWLLTGMQGKKHVWLLNLMNLFVGVRLSIVSFFLLVFQSFPWRDQNFWASNGNFCTLDNLSCGAQFPNFWGEWQVFWDVLQRPWPRLAFQACFPKHVRFLYLILCGMLGEPWVVLTSVMQLTCWAYMPDTRTHTHTIPFRRRLLRVLQNQRSDYARKLCILRRHLLWNNYHHNHDNNYNDNVHRSADYPNYHDHSIRCFSGCVLVYTW